MKKDEGYFSSKDNTRLYWQSIAPEAPKAWVAVVHGYGDHSGRYRVPMEALAKAGFASMALDYRGHGKADGKRGDVLHWSDYLDDLDVFWARVRQAAGSLPTFVLSHSNGSLIASHWAARKPAGLQGLLLGSPFYELAFQPPALKLLGARLIRPILPGLSLNNELKIEQLSRDEAWQKESAADPLYIHVTTPRWFFETLGAQAQLAGKGRELTLPIYMWGGDSDAIASMPAAKAFFDTIASTDKTWKEWPGMRHEVLNELGKEEVYATIASWISAHL